MPVWRPANGKQFYAAVVVWELPLASTQEIGIRFSVAAPMPFSSQGESVPLLTEIEAGSIPAAAANRCSASLMVKSRSPKPAIGVRFLGAMPD